MPRKGSVRLIIEVTRDFKEIVRGQAKRHNMTMRNYILRLINNELLKREKIFNENDRKS